MRNVLHRAIRADAAAGEIQRFPCALETRRAELQRLRDRVQVRLGSGEAETLSTHLSFPQHPEVLEVAEHAVRDRHRCLESAIRGAAEVITQVSGAAGRSYVGEWADDLSDLERRALRHVTKLGRTRYSRAPWSWRERLPSALLGIGRRQLVGIVTRIGGGAGDAAILMGALGISAVAGVPGCQLPRSSGSKSPARRSELGDRVRVPDGFT
jgi:phosphoenolpyruvate-protein kinase (PTS system EI component)